ncbi:hypothetical protein ACJMK2_031829 [Sinanodonta woodiana]|uniref:Uncharacterized protein n=1 Tax=Sinanodonta woodiana TaxID=1069815 RepID=A0ABD3X3V3_SINWO
MADGKNFVMFTQLESLQSMFNLQLKPLTQNKAKIVLKKLQNEFYRMGNQAWIHYLEYKCPADLKKIEQILTKIERLSKDKISFAVGKSELAYSYARFGILYYTRADTLYEEVLKDVESSKNVPLFLWQYGCALSKKRLLYCSKQQVHSAEKDFDDTFSRSTCLFFEVTKLNENKRFQARSWAQLGDLAVLGAKYCKNIKNLFPATISILTATKMFQKACDINSQVNDITVFEMCANHWKRLGQYDMCKNILRKTLQIKETSRANQMLAGILRKQLFKKTKRKRPNPDSEECLEILHLYESASASQNLAALGYKGQFLMEIGEKEQAIKVFESVYSSFQHENKEQEDFDWKTKILCQTMHAKCLLHLKKDAASITRAKELLWSVIGLSLGLREMGQMEHNLIQEAIAVMKNLLQNKTIAMSLYEKVALYKLFGDIDSADKLLEQIGEEEMIIVNQPEVVRRLIDLHAYDEGLFLLNQMLQSDNWPKEMKEFAIKAQINGAINALEKDDGNLGGTRALAAFDLRFPKKKDTSCTHNHLHIFILANEGSKQLTLEIQECLGDLVNLDNASCFDLMPGSLIISTLEKNMHESDVIAILLEEGDLTNTDFESQLFRTSVEIAQLVHMVHKEDMTVIVIIASDTCNIPDRLRYLPRVSLGTLFQNRKQQWLREFLLQSLLKVCEPWVQSK